MIRKVVVMLLVMCNSSTMLFKGLEKPLAFYAWLQTGSGMKDSKISALSSLPSNQTCLLGAHASAMQCM